MINETKCRECGQEFETSEKVRRHIRKHGTTYQQYVLKWKYKNVVPTCKCGCGGNCSWNVGLKDYTVFVHGHHAYGRKKSEEEKRKIGRKNKENMKRFMAENPDVAKLRSKQMRSVFTEEIEQKRIEAIRRAYVNMTEDEKKKFSDHACKLWSEHREVMDEAHTTATETFKQRFQNGEYDFISRNEKISEAITLRYIEGGFEWSRGKYTSTKTKQTIHYRSSWELELARLLDSREDVIMWEYEWTSIQYQIDGVSRRYIPDFHVEMNDGSHIMIEVKPAGLIETNMNWKKQKVAIEFCMQNNWQYMTWQPGADIS